MKYYEKLKDISYRNDTSINLHPLFNIAFLQKNIKKQKRILSLPMLFQLPISNNSTTIWCQYFFYNNAYVYIFLLPYNI